MRRDLRELAVLGLPLVGSHLAQIAVTATDTLMLGRYGAAELAAASIAGSLFFVMLILGSGFAFAVMPLVSAAVAEGDEVRVRRITRMGLWASMAFGVLTLPLFWAGEAILLAIGQPAEVAALGGQYLRIHGVLRILPALAVMVLKSHCAAQDRTRPILWITLGGAALNVPVNYALIFGHLGAPELGVRGAAVASVCVNAVMAAGFVIYIRRAMPGQDLFVRLWRVDPAILGRVVRLGAPIGLTLLAESGLFSAAAAMMGWFGTVPLAAHGAAIQIASITFMVHVGLSQAATIRAGRAWGAGDLGALRRGAAAALVASLAFAALTAVAFWTVPGALVGVFLSPDEPERAAIVGLGVTLLFWGGVFQVVDGLQVMALGLLRGVQDTAVPMVMAAVSYWLVGVPAGYLLSGPFGPPGVWMGLCVGLALAGGLMAWRFWRGPARLRGAVPA